MKKALLLTSVAAALGGITESMATNLDHHAKVLGKLMQVGKLSQEDAEKVLAGDVSDEVLLHKIKVVSPSFDPSKSEEWDRYWKVIGVDQPELDGAISHSQVNESYDPSNLKGGIMAYIRRGKVEGDPDASTLDVDKLTDDVAANVRDGEQSAIDFVKIMNGEVTYVINGGLTADEVKWLSGYGTKFAVGATDNKVQIRFYPK